MNTVTKDEFEAILNKCLEMIGNLLTCFSSISVSLTDVFKGCYSEHKYSSSGDYKSQE